MSNEKDFVIENGILKKYIGKDAAVMIPAGVMEIAEDAFRGCYTVSSVTIPEGVKELNLSSLLDIKEDAVVELPSSLEEIRARRYGYFSTAGVNTILNQRRKEYTFKTPRGLNHLRWEEMEREMGLLLHLFCSETESFPVPKELKTFVQRKWRDVFLRGLDFSLGGTRLILRSWKKVPVEILDEMAALASEKGKAQIAALLLQYKKEYYTELELEQKEIIREEKEFGLRERSISDWRKIFKISVKDGEATISGYKGEEKEVIIPEKAGEYPVTAIGSRAFYRNKDLEAVLLHSEIKKIGAQAFYGCTALKQMTYPLFPPSIRQEDIPGTCRALTMIPTDFKMVTMYLYLCRLKDLEEVVLEEGVTSLGSLSFAGCKKIIKVKIPASVTVIQADAFQDSPNVTIHAPAGSFAEAYAKENNIPFVAE